MFTISSIDYKKYTMKNEIVSKVSLSFIKKYKLIPYTIYKNEIIILCYDLNLFKLKNLQFYFEQKIQIVKISKLEWFNIFNRIELLGNQQKALITYKSDTSNLTTVLKENDDKNLYQAEITNAPIVKLVDSIISEGIVLKVSDIHFEPALTEIRIRVRLDGKLVLKSVLPITSLSEIVSRIKVMSNLDITKKHVPQDGKIPFKYNNTDYDIRVSIIPTIYGERIALRVLDFKDEGKMIKDLGFSSEMKEEVVKLINNPQGLILICGPTGSGKSTTLNAFLKENLKRNDNIITVEDPVEYTVDGISQVQINEEGGLTFAQALRSILRQDPNIIMIGEIRDVETAQIACRASITGHLVFSTLHTSTALGAFNRLIDMGIENYLLVDALKGIISQRLVRVLCPKCKKKVTHNDSLYKLDLFSEDDKLYKAKGCPHCNNTGYNGRIGVYELIIVDDDLKNLIAKGASYKDCNDYLHKINHQTLLNNGIELVKKGITSFEEVTSVIV